MMHVEELAVQSRERIEFIKLDRDIERVIKESGVRDGVCHIVVLHTTAGVMIN